MLEVSTILFRGFGRIIYEQLAEKWRAAGFRDVVVTNPTGDGKKFYPKVGFKINVATKNLTHTLAVQEDIEDEDGASDSAKESDRQVTNA